MFEVVIVPLDGSELAEAALEPARAICEKFGSLLLLVRAIEPASHLIVTQPPALLDSPASAEANIELIEQIVQAEHEEATKYLEPLIQRIGAGIKVEYVVVEAQPREAITEVADERKADLIVMSSHGRGGLGRVIFGSVADHVLRNSHTKVMLIRLEEPS